MQAAKRVNTTAQTTLALPPVTGKFTQRQRDIYDIVVDCHDLALDVAKPGVRYLDVHLAVCRLMTDVSSSRS